MKYFVKNGKKIWNILTIAIFLFNGYYFVVRKYTDVDQGVRSFFCETDTILDRALYKDLSEEYSYLNRNYDNKSVVVFLGDSITKRFNTDEYFSGVLILNRGIPFDTTFGLKERLSQNIKNLKIEKLFLMIGLNDLRFRTNEEILENIQAILSQIDVNQVFVQSILPITSSMPEYNKRIVHLNHELQRQCNQSGFSYIDLHSHFLDKQGGLSSEYSRDGVHLNRNGNFLWSMRIRSFLMDGSFKK